MAAVKRSLKNLKRLETQTSFAIGNIYGYSSIPIFVFLGLGLGRRWPHVVNLNYGNQLGEEQWQSGKPEEKTSYLPWPKLKYRPEASSESGGDYYFRIMTRFMYWFYVIGIIQISRWPSLSRPLSPREI